VHVHVHVHAHVMIMNMCCMSILETLDAETRVHRCLLAHSPLLVKGSVDEKPEHVMAGCPGTSG